MTDENKTENVLTKMSLKTLGCQPAQAKVDQNTVAMARIIGVARGIKTAVGQNGDTVYGLTGNFKGTCIKSGKEYISGVCYLPGGVHELILDPLDAMIADGDKAAAVNFAFDIFAVPAANPAGYSFTAVNLAPASRADPFAEITSAIAGHKLPVLTAPVKKGEEATAS